MRASAALNRNVTRDLQFHAQIFCRAWLVRQKIESMNPSSQSTSYIEWHFEIIIVGKFLLATIKKRLRVTEAIYTRIAIAPASFSAQSRIVANLIKNRRKNRQVENRCE